MFRMFHFSVALLLIASCTSTPRDSREIQKELAGLSSEEGSVREKAVKELAARGSGAIKPVVQVMAAEDHTAAPGARLALEALTYRTSAPRMEKERARVASALLAEASQFHPAEVRRWLLRMVSFSGGEESVERLVNLLEDLEVGDMALFALSRIPGKKALGALIQRLSGEAVKGKVALIQAIARRGDRAGAQVLSLHAQSGNQDVRLAAIEGLGKIPDPRGEPVLWKALTAGSELERKRARAAYLELADSLLNAGDAKKAASMFQRVLSQENWPLADQCAGLAGMAKIEGKAYVPFLVEIVETGPTQLAGSAVDMLLRIEGEEVTLSMAEAALKAKEPIRVHLIHALNRRKDGAVLKAAENLVAAMQDSPPAERARILAAFGERRDRSLAKIFLKATRDPDEEAAVAAIQALSLLQDPESVPRLLEIAREGRSGEKAAAIRGYIHFGDGLAAKNREEALQIFLRVLEMPDGESSKELALSRLGNLGDLAAVPAMRPYLVKGSDSLKRAAASAIAPLAIKLAEKGSKDEAASLLREIVVYADNPEVVQSAVRKLRELGEEVEVPVREGYVKYFWVIGPFPGRDELRKTDLLPVDKPVDLSIPVSFKGKSCTWKYHPLDHIHGRLNLLQELANVEDAGAYVYAEVFIEESREATFKIGSDDDVFCWLNGQLIHKFEGGRGWSADQDSVDVHLKPGGNSILLKVLNRGGQWDVSLRITDRKGNPLLLIERKE